nr:unnamed protein product [Callosobruchus analis]
MYWVHKANLEAEYQVHLKEAKLARIEEEQDKNSQNRVVAIFDLQAVLPCPSGQTSAFYYVSKLSVFNLTVCNLKSKQVNCFVWHEAEAHRGANEVGDNAHSVIERQISRFKRSAPIYTPAQYYSLTRSAKKSGEPYQLTEISHEDIYDLKSLTNGVGYNHVSRTEEGNIFKLSDVKIVKVERGNMGKLSVSRQLNSTVNVIKNRRSDYNIHEISLKKAFLKRPVISKNKKHSLLSLFKRKREKPIHMTYFPFYNSL